MLDQILEEAGELNHKPLPCIIPKQWLPGFIRWPLRVFLLPFVWLDLFAQNIAKKLIRPPFKMVGTCKKRGNCCYYILIRKSKGWGAFLDLFWHTQVNGFYRREKNCVNYNGMQVYMMGCRYLKKDGSCGVYKLRPTICRTWPRIEVFGQPQLLKGCGFKAEFKHNKKGDNK